MPDNTPSLADQGARMNPAERSSFVHKALERNVTLHTELLQTESSVLLEAAQQQATPFRQHWTTYTDVAGMRDQCQAISPRLAVHIVHHQHSGAHNPLVAATTSTLNAAVLARVYGGATTSCKYLDLIPKGYLQDMVVYGYLRADQEPPTFPDPSTLYVVAKSSPGFAREDQHKVDIVAVLSHPDAAKKLASATQANVRELVLNYTPPGLLQTIKELNLHFNA